MLSWYLARIKYIFQLSINYYNKCNQLAEVVLSNNIHRNANCGILNYCQLQKYKTLLINFIILMSYLLIFQSLVVKIGKLFVPEQGEHKNFLHTSLTKHRTSKISSYRLSRNFHKIHSIWIQTRTQPTFCTFVAQIVSISICAGNFCNFVSQIILTIKEFRKFYASHLHFLFLLLFIYNRTKVNVWEYNFPALWFHIL